MIAGLRSKPWFIVAGFALLLGLMTGITSLLPKEAQMHAPDETCANIRSLMEGRIARATGLAPHLVGDMRCRKTAYSSDLFAVAELQPDSAPAGWTFAPLQGVQEVPVDLLFEMFPEAFASDQREGLTIAAGFDPESRASVALVRRTDARLFVLVSDQM